MTTGLVFTLPAMASDVSGALLEASRVRAWTEMAKRKLEFICNNYSYEYIKVKGGNHPSEFLVFLPAPLEQIREK
jgi:hypothetical protein